MQLEQDFDWCREVLEESRELRIVLCREKRSGSRVGSAVVAACGESLSGAPSYSDHVQSEAERQCIIQSTNNA